MGSPEKGDESSRESEREDGIMWCWCKNGGLREKGRMVEIES